MFVSFLRVVWLAIAAAFFVLCLAFLIVGFGAEPDPSHRCVGTSRDGCFAREPAVVERPGSEPRVSYEDGLRTTKIYLRSTPPLHEGQRVWLERWDGEIVAISDRATERRYRADDWVDRWSERTFWSPLVWTAISGAILFATIRGFVRRRRR